MDDIVLYDTLSEENTLHKLIDPGIDIGGDVFSAAIGSTIGFVIAGPAGVAAGAMAGSISKKLFCTIGNEILGRAISERERTRIGFVAGCALEKIQQNIESGIEMRNDPFFESNNFNRSSAEEILEGTLLAAQREYQEQKLLYLGNLYGNLVFHPEITKEEANLFLQFAKELSFNQLCMLAFFAKREEVERFKIYKLGDKKLISTGHNRHQIDEGDIFTCASNIEFEKLSDTGFIGQLGYYTARTPDISDQELTNFGHTFAELTELKMIDDAHICEAIKFAFKIKK